MTLVRSFIGVLSGLALLVSLAITPARAQGDAMLIDDFTDPNLVSALGTVWRGVSDSVMGGVSEAIVARETVDGRPALRLTGAVRLENDGGFIQASLDLVPDGGAMDASDFTGVRLVVRGNGEQYNVHLRTPDNVRPWQSYRATFTAGADWTAVALPFAAFAPYRVEAPLDVTRLRRIGRAFQADLAVAEVAFYR